ncbi:hypothetical protein PG991_012123 [Apiospora marii]|uniref:Nuf2 DHR10-like domain-containing protein n=1 Tax=Apiospora marii TaxID=335849 RepID=A0ABR1R8Y3_9PEZI
MDTETKMTSALPYAEMRRLAETKLRYLSEIKVDMPVDARCGKNLLTFFASMCTNMEQLEQQLKQELAAAKADRQKAADERRAATNDRQIAAKERNALVLERATVAQEPQDLRSLKSDHEQDQRTAAAQTAQASKMNELADTMKQVDLNVASLDQKLSQTTQQTDPGDQVSAIAKLTVSLEEHARTQTEHHAELAIQISQLTNLAVDEKAKDRCKINRLRTMQALADAELDEFSEINRDLAGRYEAEKSLQRNTYKRFEQAKAQRDECQRERDRLRDELDSIRVRSRELSPPKHRSRSRGRRHSRPLA